MDLKGCKMDFEVNMRGGRWGGGEWACWAACYTGAEKLHLGGFVGMPGYGNIGMYTWPVLLYEDKH